MIHLQKVSFFLRIDEPWAIMPCHFRTSVKAYELRYRQVWFLPQESRLKKLNGPDCFQKGFFKKVINSINMLLLIWCDYLEKYFFHIKQALSSWRVYSNSINLYTNWKGNRDRPDFSIRGELEAYGCIQRSAAECSERCLYGIL